MIGRDSRYNYAATMLVTDAAGFLTEKPHLDIRPQLQNIINVDNQEYIPSPNDTWSRIAWRKLGHGRHWWIIADFSQTIDPFLELRPIRKTKYVTQLTVDIPGITNIITQITVADARKVKRGDVILVEDLTQTNLVSVELAVISTN